MPKKNETSSTPSLKEGDFYWNAQGLTVFTEQYHRRRGYCCRNECRHCPWDFKKLRIENEK